MTTTTGTRPRSRPTRTSRRSPSPASSTHRPSGSTAPGPSPTWSGSGWARGRSRWTSRPGTAAPAAPTATPPAGTARRWRASTARSTRRGPASAWCRPSPGRGCPTASSLETMTFEPLEGGRCRIVVVSVVDSMEAQAAMMASGMEVGINEGYEKLDELLGGRAAAEPRRGAPSGRRRSSPIGCAGATDWDAPAPVDGWAARDVVRHLVEWFPAFLEGGAGVQLPAGPSVDDDPVGGLAGARRRHPGAARRPRDRRRGAHEPAHRRGAARRGGRPVLHRRRLHAHLGPGPGHRPGRDARPREVRGAAGRDGADGRGAAGQRAVRRRRSPVPADADVQTRLLGFIGRDRPVRRPWRA